DSTGALALKSVPGRMLIIGGGIIGLEMGTVYSALGARLDVVEMLPTLMTGADRDLVKVWDKMNARRFDHVMLNTKTVAADTRSDSTGALALKSVPGRMLIIGGGIIGLEMGTVYSALGARLDVVEMLPTLMTGADRDLVKVWDKMNARRFDHVMLNTKTVAAET